MDKILRVRPFRLKLLSSGTTCAVVCKKKSSIFWIWNLTFFHFEVLFVYSLNRNQQCLGLSRHVPKLNTSCITTLNTNFPSNERRVWNEHRDRRKWTRKQDMVFKSMKNIISAAILLHWNLLQYNYSQGATRSLHLNIPSGDKSLKSVE